MTPLRLGIVGAGSIVAKKHLLALAEVPEIAVAGLCRRDAGELQMLADRFRVPRRYTDYRDLLSDPGIDAVLVATGPAAQPEIVMAAAAAGKHVFAEKPMATTAAEARTVAEALRHSPVYVQIGFNKRFYFGYRTAWELMRAGELGAPTGFQARFWFQPGRADPLLHNGIHFLDLAQFFMGPVTEVFARTAEPLPSAATTAGTWAVSLRIRQWRGGQSPPLVPGVVGLRERARGPGGVESQRPLRGGRPCRPGVPTGRRTTCAAVREHPVRPLVVGQRGAGVHRTVPGLRSVRLPRTPRAAWARQSAGLLAAEPEDGVRALELLEAVRDSAAHGRSVTLPVHGQA